MGIYQICRHAKTISLKVLVNLKREHQCLHKAVSMNVWKCQHTCEPLTTDWKPEPQRRFTVNAGVSIGTPTLRLACRDIYDPSLADWQIQKHNNIVNHTSTENVKRQRCTIVKEQRCKMRALSAKSKQVQSNLGKGGIAPHFHLPGGSSN